MNSMEACHNRPHRLPRLVPRQRGFSFQDFAIGCQSSVRISMARLSDMSGGPAPALPGGRRRRSAYSFDLYALRRACTFT